MWRLVQRTLWVLIDRGREYLLCLLVSMLQRIGMPAGCGYLSYLLMHFRRWSDELRYLPRFLAVFALTVLELLIENFLVWCGPHWAQAVLCRRNCS